MFSRWMTSVSSVHPSPMERLRLPLWKTGDSTACLILVLIGSREQMKRPRSQIM